MYIFGSGGHRVLVTRKYIDIEYIRNTEDRFETEPNFLIFIIDLYYKHFKVLGRMCPVNSTESFLDDFGYLFSFHSED